MPQAASFREQHVATVPPGYRVRTVSRGTHRVRIAFPPGPSRRGAGQVVEILHPRSENPCPISNPAELLVVTNPRGRSENPAELLVMTNPTKQLFHRCDGKIYTSERARVHPHAVTPKICLKGWRKATKREEARKFKRKNPESTGQASELYQQFHGEPSKHIDEYTEPSQRGVTLTELGDLVELRVKSPTGWKIRAIEFQGCDVKLASNPGGTQLYLVGGNQGGPLAVFGADRTKEMLDLGEAVYIAYRAKKAHVNGISSEYEHNFGENTGVRPRLMMNRSLARPRLFFVGGEYTVRPEGIVN